MSKLGVLADLKPIIKLIFFYSSFCTVTIFSTSIVCFSFMRQMFTHQLPTNATQNGTGYHSHWTTQTFVIPYAAALGEGEQWACQVLLSQYLLLRSSNCLNLLPRNNKLLCSMLSEVLKPQNIIKYGYGLFCMSVHIKCVCIQFKLYGIPQCLNWGASTNSFMLCLLVQSLELTPDISYAEPECADL